MVRYAAGIFALLVADASQLALPQVLKGFVNTIQSTGVVARDILPFALELVALAVIVFVSRFLWRNLVQGAARILDFDLRRDLFHKFTELSPNYFDHHKTGDLMAHATNDLMAVRNAMSMGIVMVADSAFLIISTVVIMFSTISVSLSLWALIPLPLAGLVTALMGRKIHARFLAVQNQFSHLSDHVQENFSGIRVVKSFVQEGPELDRLEEESREYWRRNIHLVRIWALIDPLVVLIQGIAFAIGISYGGVLVIQGHLSLGSFVAFMSYLTLLLSPMEAIGYLVNLVQRAGASLERLEAIFRERPEITDAPEAVTPPLPVRGDILYKDLTFSYPDVGHPTLENISFHLEAGQTLGLIGRTGSGKSTLVDLLLRLYDPPEGTVFFDGTDVRKMPLALLRESIGYVPPDSFLFSETISENIAFGADGLDEDFIEACAEIAQVKDNIDRFPRGFATLLGERGITLSGGQKQRVSVARAIAKNPTVLILDDAFSAVDTQTEEGILRRLKELRSGRTTLIVAHRVSTLKHADLILVMDRGHIVESGTHESLVANDGLYASIHRRQLLEEKIAGRTGEGVGA